MRASGGGGGGTYGGQRCWIHGNVRTPVVGFPVWVPGMECPFSERAVSAIFETGERMLISVLQYSQPSPKSMIRRDQILTSTERSNSIY